MMQGGKLLKRGVDIVGSFVGIILLSPLLLLTAAWIALSLGRPVLFYQVRPGVGGKPFGMVKFRTMTNFRDDQGQLLPDAERLTEFGRFLRSTSLDELPELWNVLKGDMSLVGPRPLLMEYLPLYSAEQARRHLLPPGMTGWAQVNGRNLLSWEHRFALDCWYIDHQSFWLDLRILIRTVALVLARRGISEEGHATMPKFCGAQRTGSDSRG